MLVSEAAERLGMSPQTLRLALQHGKCDFGFAVQSSPHRFTYYVNEKRLERYLEGIDYEKDSYYWDIARTSPERILYNGFGRS